MYYPENASQSRIIVNGLFCRAKRFLVPSLSCFVPKSFAVARLTVRPHVCSRAGKNLG